MSMDALEDAAPDSRFEQLRYAREILEQEGQAIETLAQNLDQSFCDVIEQLDGCCGHVQVTGMGKAGLIGQKIAATLASTGTRSHFLHPAEAFHGDLGMIHPQDVVLLLSFSGETEEIVRLLPILREMGNPLIAITGHSESTLARRVDHVLGLGKLREAGVLELAPSTSTTVMLALGDALALVLSRKRKFGADDFAKFHPGGSLGRRLARVQDLMRPLAQCRVASQDTTIRDVFISGGRPGRRTGAVMLVDDQGALTGIFTDSDLARLLENRRDSAIDESIGRVMTRQPATLHVQARFAEALELLVEQKISEIPVVNSAGQPVGMIDITDVIDSVGDADANQDAPQTFQFPNQFDQAS